MNELWLCLDCLNLSSLDTHGRCSRCGSNAVVDNNERAFIAEQELNALTQEAEWLNWAERVIEGAERERQ
jgi:hypothetical protein